MRRMVLAWLAHLYTALGLVCAAVMAVLIVRGDDRSFRWAFFLMMVATAIDATDGWLARKARVTETLPGFDGGTLDNLIDFHTYTSLPLLLLWRADVLPGTFGWVLLVPLLASGYGFAQVHAKTPDGFFIGFPSYWNIVAFYLYVLHPALWISTSGTAAVLCADIRADAVSLRLPRRTVRHGHQRRCGGLVRAARAGVARRAVRDPQAGARVGRLPAVVPGAVRRGCRASAKRT